MKLLIVQFYPASCCFISLRSNIFSTLFSDTLSVCSLNVRDQVSHPYNITGKIIVLYVLVYIFRLQTGRQKFLDCKSHLQAILTFICVFLYGIHVFIQHCIKYF
jgi:hypothetical protein